MTSPPVVNQAGFLTHILLVFMAGGRELLPKKIGGQTKTHHQTHPHLQISTNKEWKRRFLLRKYNQRGAVFLFKSQVRPDEYVQVQTLQAQAM